MKANVVGFEEPGRIEGFPKLGVPTYYTGESNGNENGKLNGNCDYIGDYRD